MVGNEVACGTWVEVVGTKREVVFFKTSTGSTIMMAVGVCDEMLSEVWEKWRMKRRGG
jgi:hypothetical protein